MADPLPDTNDNESMPRWVKRLLIGGGLVVVLVIVAMLTGHGPWHHLQMAGMHMSGDQPPMGGAQ